MAKFSSLMEGSKARNLVIIITVMIAIIALIGFFIYKSNQGPTTGVAKIAQVPQSIAFQPGTVPQGLSKQYLKTLLQSNRTAAEEALKSGRSEIPSMLAKKTEHYLPGAAGTQQPSDVCPPCCYPKDTSCDGEDGFSGLLDRMVQKESVSPVIAAELTSLQDASSSTSAIAAQLHQYVSKNKLTAKQSSSLLICYRANYRAPTALSPGDSLDQLVSEGKLSPEIAADLYNAIKSGATAQSCHAMLNQMSSIGKITADQQKALSAVCDRLSAGAASVAASDVAKQLLDAGAISANTASTLKALHNGNPAVGDYAADINQMVADKELTRAQANKLIAAYRKAHGVATAQTTSTDGLLNQLQQSGAVSPDVAQQLKNLSASGVPADQYGAAISQLVKNGKLSPATAQQLLAAYRAEHGDTAISSHAQSDAVLARALRQQQLQRVQAQQQALQMQQTAQSQKDLGKVQSNMSAQAKALFASWNAVPQQFVTHPEKKSGKADSSSNGSASAANGNGSNGGAKGYPIIKTGTIMFAVLDTAVNSDQPGPILATMVAGKYKGAKLMGSIKRTSDGERLMLSFSMLTMPSWPDTVQIKAVAVNPDSARTALASSVNHHYLVRYGTLFASAFLSGYAKAVLASGQSVQTSGGATTTSNPDISPKGKLMVGFGEIGNKLSTQLKNVFNKKPTVKIDAGVGLGILFTNDVHR